MAPNVAIVIKKLKAAKYCSSGILYLKKFATRVTLL